MSSKRSIRRVAKPVRDLDLSIPKIIPAKDLQALFEAYDLTPSQQTRMAAFLEKLIYEFGNEIAKVKQRRTRADDRKKLRNSIERLFQAKRYLKACGPIGQTIIRNNISHLGEMWSANWIRKTFSKFDLPKEMYNTDGQRRAGAEVAGRLARGPDRDRRCCRQPCWPRASGGDTMNDAPQEYIAKAISNEAAVVANAQASTRNGILNRSAFKLGTIPGAQLDTVVGALLPAASDNGYPRLTVEELAADCLDVSDLNQAGALDEEWVTFRRPEFRWPTVRKMRAARYRVLIELHNQVVPQQIRVSWMRCHFGGARPYLHCPFCEKRVARLFKGFSGYFCRPCCGNPVYESQTRNKKARAYLQAYRARQQLGGSRPAVDPVPERPYGMKHKTYARLCDKIERLEQSHIGSRVVRHAPLWIRPLTY